MPNRRSEEKGFVVGLWSLGREEFRSCQSEARTRRRRGGFAVGGEGFCRLVDENGSRDSQIGTVWSVGILGLGLGPLGRPIGDGVARWWCREEDSKALYCLSLSQL